MAGLAGAIIGYASASRFEEAVYLFEVLPDANTI
jgi:pentatricopeptide repeat protein